MSICNESVEVKTLSINPDGPESQVQKQLDELSQKVDELSRKVGELVKRIETMEDELISDSMNYKEWVNSQ